MPSLIDLVGWLERRRLALSVMLGAGAVVLLMLAGPSAALEQTFQTMRDRMRMAEASGRIAIVEIDAASLADHDRWPWPRSLHGRLVRALDAGGARMIAFDVDFSSRSTAREDAAFAAALAQVDRAVILPTFRQASADGRRHEVENLPIPEFRRHVALAAVNVNPGRDGQVRRMSTGVVTAGVARPSLPALVAGQGGSIGDSFPIDYGIDAATIPRLSFADVVAGRVPAASIAGRDLIVGTTAIEIGDRYPVPGYGVIPGVVIQALAAETLRRSGVPVELGPLPILAVALVVLLASARRRRRALRWSLPVAAAALMGGAALVAEATGPLRFDIAPGLLLLAVAGATLAVIGHASRIARASLSDEATGLGNGRALVRTLAGVPQVGIGVVAVQQHQALAALLGAGRLDEMVSRLAERIEGVTPADRIWRVEDNVVAFAVDGWRDDLLDESMDGLVALMRAPFFCAGRPIDLPVTFGFAEGAGRDAAALVADAAFAAAGAAERGERWARAAAQPQADAEWGLSILSELDQAIADGSLWVAYQPKLDLASGRIKGAEALVRWQHPTRGAIPPDRFVPQIEARGQMLELTLHVLRTALADAAATAAAGDPFDVAVNLSTTLLPRPGVAEAIVAMVGDSGVDPARLTIEVTESAAVELTAETIETLTRLRQAGIRISVDDYGTGQSTITYLRRFPAQELKIDKSFVQSVLTDESDAILVRSTIRMAHDLGLSVVAEGVEDRATLDALAAMGCDTIQGYFVGRPVALREFRDRLIAERSDLPAAA